MLRIASTVGVVFGATSVIAGKAVPLGNEVDYVSDEQLPDGYVYSNSEANRYDSQIKPYREEYRNKYHLTGLADGNEEGSEAVEQERLMKLRQQYSMPSKRVHFLGAHAKKVHKHKHKHHKHLPKVNRGSKSCPCVANGQPKLSGLTVDSPGTNYTLADFDSDQYLAVPKARVVSQVGNALFHAEQAKEENSDLLNQEHELDDGNAGATSYLPGTYGESCRTWETDVQVDPACELT